MCNCYHSFIIVIGSQLFALSRINIFIVKVIIHVRISPDWLKAPTTERVTQAIVTCLILIANVYLHFDELYIKQIVKKHSIFVQLRQTLDILKDSGTLLPNRLPIL